MSTNSLTCPHCSQKVDLSTALRHDVEQSIEQNLRQKIQSELSQKLSEKHNLEQADLRNRLQEEQNKAKAAAAKELELRKVQRELENFKESQQAELQKQVEEQKLKLRQSLEKDLAEKIQSQFALEQQDLRSQLLEEKKKASEAQEKELELRRMQRELEDRQQQMKLELQRQLDHERSLIAEQTMKVAQAETAHVIEQQRLKMYELQKALDEARIKSLQGSQQTQGEALELRLEEDLSRLFPADDFEPVPKGIRGADLIQRVRSASGKLAGTILWEFKQTKTWSDDWIYKLKEDQRELSAEIAAIVTSTLPRTLNHMGTVENIWVAQPHLAKCLAHSLREQILQVHQARATNLIPEDQKENVFRYLTGTKFRQSIEGQIETVSSLLEDLHKEKRAFVKAWASREQQLNQLLNFKASLYGDLQGILGKSLPSISHLEMSDGGDAESV
jgi:hypothetical protein